MAYKVVEYFFSGLLLLSALIYGYHLDIESSRKVLEAANV